MLYVYKKVTFYRKKNVFYTWNYFAQKFYNEKSMAKTVASNIISNGIKLFSLMNTDLQFISDTRNKLFNLKEFLFKCYSYSGELIENSEADNYYTNLDPHSNSKTRKTVGNCTLKRVNYTLH